MIVSPEEDWRHLCQMRDGAHSQSGRGGDGLCVHHERAASPVCSHVSGDSSITDGGLAANYPKSSPPRKDNIRITKR